MEKKTGKGKDLPPLVISDEDWSKWLDENKDNPDLLAGLLEDPFVLYSNNDKDVPLRTYGEFIPQSPESAIANNETQYHLAIENITPERGQELYELRMSMQYGSRFVDVIKILLNHFNVQNADINIMTRTTNSVLQDDFKFWHYFKLGRAYERSINEPYKKSLKKGLQFTKTSSSLRKKAQAEAIAQKKELLAEGKSNTKANTIVQSEFENKPEYEGLFKEWGTGNWKKFLQINYYEKTQQKKKPKSKRTGEIKLERSKEETSP